MWLKDKLRAVTEKLTPKQTEKQEKDDALFEALGEKKKRKKRKIIITVTAIVLVVAIVGVIGVSALQKKVRQQFASGQGEVLSYTATTGSISTVVSGSGSLTDVDLETIAVPETVEITEVLVRPNQSLAKGDIIATVEMTTVVSTMADLQTQIEDLDDQISAAEDDAASTSVYAGVTGRVKAVFGQSGDDVGEVMYEHGALALLSLDGYMTVQIQAEGLVAGDSVTVQLSDGDTVTGTVESVVDKTVTILLTDNGPAYGEEVTVFSGETQLGTGKLDIHSALRVTGYTGRISSVNTSENAKVYSSTRLFTLADTAYSANYNSLLRQRAELEETLLQLLTVQRDGAFLAQQDCSVYSVDYSEETPTGVVTLSTGEKMSVTISVDEADILSLELGQSVTVTVSSVSDSSFTGTLTEIDRSSATSGSYSAVVEFAKAEGMLSGMTASVSVRIQGVENAILIPIEAVHKTSDGAYVYTSYNEELQEYGGKVDVVTGIENSTYIEIKSGLQEGDTVYYTEQTSQFGGMSGMSGMPGGMSGMPGGFSGSGGEMPDFGSMGGGQMPSFSGGMPSGMGSGMGGFGGRGG